MSVAPGTNELIPPERGHDSEYDASTKSPQQIEEDIADTRAKLGELLDEIERELAPRQLLERGMDMLKETMNGDLRDLAQTLGQHPVPLALIGMGVGWMLLSEGTRSRVSERANDLVKQVRAKVSRTAAPPGDPAASQSEPSAGYAYARQKSGRVMGEAQGRFSHMSDATRQGMERVGEYARASGERLNDLRIRVGALADDNPLALGVLGLLAGGAIALLLSRSQVKDRRVGSAGGEVHRRVARVGRDEVERAQDLGQTVDADLQRRGPGLSPARRPFFRRWRRGAGLIAEPG